MGRGYTPPLITMIYTDELASLERVYQAAKHVRRPTDGLITDIQDWEALRNAVVAHEELTRDD